MAVGWRLQLADDGGWPAASGWQLLASSVGVRRWWWQVASSKTPAVAGCWWPKAGGWPAVAVGWIWKYGYGDMDMDMEIWRF